MLLFFNLIQHSLSITKLFFCCIFSKFVQINNYSFSDLLDDAALRDVESTLNWLLEIQTENGNFAPSVEEIGINRGSNELVHWCHGATGAVPLMIAAYLCTKKVKFLEVFLIYFLQMACILMQ